MEIHPNVEDTRNGKDGQKVEEEKVEKEETAKFALKREIGLWGGVSFYVGVMIGEMGLYS